MGTDIEKQTETVFKRHLESILARDVDRIVEGFAEGAAVFAPDGPVRSHESIRGVIAEFIGQ